MNKIVMVFLSILIAVVLIPIVVTSADNSKINYENITFSITSTSTVITNDLTDDEILFIFNNYGSINTVTDITDTIGTQSYVSATPSETPIRLVETNYPALELNYINAPIQIHAGDILTFDVTGVSLVGNVLYTERYSNATGGAIWGFSSGGNGATVDYKVLYNSTEYILWTGAWNSRSFSANYFDTWIDWSVVGSVGTLEFLQDFPVALTGIYKSTDSYVALNTTWQNVDSFNNFTTIDVTYPTSTIDLEFDTATITFGVDKVITSDEELVEGSQTVVINFAIVLDNAMTDIIDLLPLIFVLIVIVGSTTYLIVKKK